MSLMNCYRLESALEADFDPADFHIESIRRWLVDVRRLRIGQAAPRFLVKLDALSRVALGSTERFDVLRELKRPLLKLAVALPQPMGASPRAADEALTLEQRLYCLMVRNLRQALQDLDYARDSYSAEVDKRRRWLLRNLFSFLGRQVEYGMLWGRPLPGHTWQTLHDLYSYVAVRRIGRSAGSRRSRGKQDFDPALEYRRLLLIGLTGVLLEEWRVNTDLFEQAAVWAADTRLAESDAYVGEFQVFVVETSRDKPPARIPGSLTESFRGWILLAPDAYFAFLDRRRREPDAGEAAAAAFRSSRSAFNS